MAATPSSKGPAATDPAKPAATMSAATTDLKVVLM
jgi:hypothetical protein